MGCSIISMIETDAKSRAVTTGSCPIVNDFDPFNPQFLADPYSSFARLRVHGPVFFSPTLDRWIVTGYEEIQQVLLDPRSFSATESLRPLYPVVDEARRIMQVSEPAPGLANADPPVHTRNRQVIMRALSPQRITRMSSVIKLRAAELIDKFINERSADRRVDIITELCHPLPAAIMFDLIGFPPSDHPMLKEWCDDKTEVIWGRPSSEQQIQSAHSLVAFLDHCRELVQSRRSTPADDLVSALVADERDLTDHEIASLVFYLSFAGHETTTNLIANSLVQLLSRPAVWEELRADRKLIPNAVEEVLRFDTSILMWRRVATRDTAIGDVDIPKDARVVLAFGAAARQADRFPDPDNFDIRRSDARRHLAFGKGIHLCAGANLARLEADIALNSLMDRLPSPKLAKQELQYYPNVTIRGPRALYIEW